MRNPKCPNDAISMGNDIYEINPDLCTECVGHYDKPSLSVGMPITNTIIIDPAHTESQDELWEKFVLIHHADKI